jgi:serine carboxypeptidase-like clade 1
VEDDPHTLKLNPHSWNKIVNMIFVESPCGVGFSYAEDGNYTSGDDQAANDNYNFILSFFNKAFPEFAKNPFFIAGESYAGHYVPQVSKLVYENLKSNKLNLKGFSAGNPSTDWPIEAPHYWPFMAAHGLVSSEDFDYAKKVCGANFTSPTAQCATAIKSMRQALNRINPYDIYAPCIGKASQDGGCLTDHLLAISLMEESSNSLYLSNSPRSPFSQTFIPCINVTAPQLYMQWEEVQRALFVVPQSQKYEWTACSAHLNYVQYAPSVLAIYRQLSPHLRVLVYSGDVDSCVPFSSTQAAIDSLRFPLTSPWRAWLVDNQVAGYVKGFQFPMGSLTFATVKNAGHMVPTYQPKPALEMFSRFIHDQPL